MLFAIFCEAFCFFSRRFSGQCTQPSPQFHSTVVAPYEAFHMAQDLLTDSPVSQIPCSDPSWDKGFQVNWPPGRMCSARADAKSSLRSKYMEHALWRSSFVKTVQASALFNACRPHWASTCRSKNGCGGPLVSPTQESGQKKDSNAKLTSEKYTCEFWDLSVNDWAPGLWLDSICFGLARVFIKGRLVQKLPVTVI